MSHRTFRRPAISAVAVAGLIFASGCSAVEPKEIDDGVKVYRALSTELVEVLAAKYPQVAWQRDGEDSLEPAEKPGVCEYHAARYRSPDALDQVSPQFTGLMPVINPVLEKHGFSKVTELKKVPGGWTVIESKDATGAVLDISAKGSASLSLDATLAANDCAAALPAY